MIDDFLGRIMGFLGIIHHCVVCIFLRRDRENRLYVFDYRSQEFSSHVHRFTGAFGPEAIFAFLANSALEAKVMKTIEKHHVLETIMGKELAPSSFLSLYVSSSELMPTNTRLRITSR